MIAETLALSKPCSRNSDSAASRIAWRLSSRRLSAGFSIGADVFSVSFLKYTHPVFMFDL